jgi:hypothetical protein
MSAFGGKADIVPSCSQRDEARDRGECRQARDLLPESHLAVIKEFKSDPQ